MLFFLVTNSTESLTLDYGAVWQVWEKYLLYVCVYTNVHGCLLVCVWMCVYPHVFESWVLRNSDSVCNILESLDCLFMENVQ